jgi:hypothetical protein
MHWSKQRCRRFALKPAVSLMKALLPCALVILCLTHLKSQAQTNSGFNAFESGTMGGTTGGYDNMWADSTQHRWMLNNFNHGNLPVAAWPGHGQVANPSHTVFQT